LYKLFDFSSQRDRRFLKIIKGSGCFFARQDDRSEASSEGRAIQAKRQNTDPGSGKVVAFIQSTGIGWFQLLYVKSEASPV
jgi:hypothetical protein